MIEGGRCGGKRRGQGRSLGKTPPTDGHRNGFRVAWRTSACPIARGLAGKRRLERRWRTPATTEIRRKAFRSGDDGRGEAACGRGRAGRPKPPQGEQDAALPK